MVETGEVPRQNRQPRHNPYDMPGNTTLARDVTRNLDMEATNEAMNDEPEHLNMGLVVKSKSRSNNLQHTTTEKNDPMTFVGPTDAVSHVSEKSCGGLGSNFSSS